MEDETRLSSVFLVLNWQKKKSRQNVIKRVYTGSAEVYLVNDS